MFFCRNPNASYLNDQAVTGMPLWSPFAGGWQSSTFVSYETPAATEGHLLEQMDCV
jgi:hypothetical protein